VRGDRGEVGAREKAEGEEELRCHQERERMIEAEWQRYEASQQQIQTMFAYIQGLGASVNYLPPLTVPWPPPPPPPPQMTFAPMSFFPPGPAVTPVSMNVFACMRIQ